MNRDRCALRPILAVVVVLFVSTGLALSATAHAGPSPTDPSASTTSTTAVGAGPVIDVRIGDNFFRPKRIRVRAGTTVRWRNAGRNEHNVLPDRGDEFGIDDLPRGDVYAYRFDEPGKYGYYCSFHGAPRSGQYGTVIVKKAKGPRAPKAPEREGERDASTTST